MDIELVGVHVERGGRRVLEIEKLRLRGARTTAILGPNGSGKTTLLRLIAGLERLRAGSVRFEGAAHRPPIAYVFQEGVFLRRSVRDNLELGLRLRGVEKSERRARIDEAARRLSISHLMGRRADRLSGGEGRRVNLARALSLQAPLVLMDEPLEGLDGRAYIGLLDDLPQLLAVFKSTTLLVTHDRDEALRLAEDLVVLVDGKVEAAGDKHQVAKQPRTRQVAEVLGYSVLGAGGRRVAVPPGGLCMGPGAQQFSMLVEQVFDLVERREIVGRIDETRVRVALEPSQASPVPGDVVVVHAARCSQIV